jgi:hypothetical protein
MTVRDEQQASGTEKKVRGNSRESARAGKSPVPPDINELFARIQERCEAAEIECALQAGPEDEPFVRLALAAGRGKRRVVIRNAEDAAALLAVPFERYRFLERYEAIYSLDDGFIEAIFRSAGPVGGGLSGLGFTRMVQPPLGARSDAEWPPRIVLTDDVNEMQMDTDETGVGTDETGVKLEIGRPSAAMVLARRFTPRRSPSLTLRWAGLTNHDQATRLLESYSNSLFFQIDSKWGTAFQLARARQPIARRRALSADPENPLSFPHSLYDPESMSLYWYARGATGMPLLQYLAYYQVIEFYFPVHAQAEVRRRLRNVVKSPSFSPHADREIGRLVDVLHATGGQNIWGDERSQLLTTIRASLAAGSIRDLISEERYDGHFEKKVKNLADTTLRVVASDDDLITRAAERIYEIRCKIVHTKDTARNEGAGLLLPFSPEADRLWPDIDLVELASRSALAAAGKSLPRPE